MSDRFAPGTGGLVNAKAVRSRAARWALGASLGAAVAGAVPPSVAAGNVPPSVAASNVPPSVAQARFEFERTETRLSKAVRPERMQLQLDLDPELPGFSGEGTLHLRVRERVSMIELHAHKLQSTEAVLLQGAQAGPGAHGGHGGQGAQGQRGRPLRVAVDAERQTWRLEPVDGRPIAAGSYRLQLAWRGEVQSVGDGLFRVEHRRAGDASAGEGKPRMLATQLQSIHARTVLPLMDEPVFRVVFDLAVKAPAAYEVISNMPRVAKQVQGAHVVHRFAPTPPMTGYLLAVAVGRLESVESRAANAARTPLRIITAPGRSADAAFALRSTEQLLPWLEAYFGVPYALPKLDQLAVPGVRRGAMEDWGLISYIESLLLVNRATSRPQAEREVFELLAHEISHQWFGNLVSPASWNEVWLNEAFATWMERKAVAHFHPQWQPMLSTRRELERTMARDATQATRPIRGGPVAEVAVDSVFDGITYQKGAAVLAMIEAWLGDDAFRRGLGAYMRERRMKPATAGDLWHHVGRATSRPVAAMAASWTDQPGFPLVSVASRCEHGELRVTLSQERFEVGAAAADKPQGLWFVPIVAARGDEQRVWALQGPQMQVAWPGCEGPPLRLNAGGQGYYRVAYESEHVRALARSFDTLPGADQLALVSDSQALARSGRQPMAQHLHGLRAAVAATGQARPMLLMQVVEQLGQLLTDLHGTPAEAPLAAATVRLLAPVAASLGWDPAPMEPAPLQNARASLVRLLARLGHGPTLEGAEQRFEAALAGSGEVSPGMRGAVLRAAQLRGGEAAARRQEAALQAMQRADSDEQRWILFDAVVAAPNQALAERALDAAVRGELPTLQAGAVPESVAWRAEHSALVYAHLLRHWDAWAKQLGAGTEWQAWLLPSAASASSEPTMAARLVAEQQARVGVVGEMAAARVAQQLEARQQLRGREASEGEAMARALDGRAAGAAPGAAAAAPPRPQ